MAVKEETGFSFIAKDKQVFFEYYCSTDASPLSKSSILIALQDTSFAYYHVNTEGLDQFVNDTNKTLSGIQQEGQPPEVCRYQIAEAMDAKLEIDIVEDNMTGIAHLRTAQGGTPIGPDLIKQTCLDMGIRFGLKTKLVVSLIKQARRLPPGSEVSQTIVIGREVKNGKDAFIRPKMTLFSDSVRNPTVYDDGSFDMRDLGSIQTVHVGQVVAEKIPATDGEPGIDVFGQKIPPEPGKDIELKDTEGTEVSSENPNQLIAIKQGLLRRSEKTMVVDDIFVVDKLTAREGHIKFNGSVIVKGDVASDMRIDATGDVLVGGFVESAVIHCHGDLNVLGGCSGRAVANEALEGNGEESIEYACELMSGQNINVDFAAYTKIVAKEVVNSEKHLSNCHVDAKALFVGKMDKPMGKIIGGRYYLCQQLGAGFIGNKSHVHVDINMNRTYDVFIKKEKQLWQHMEDLEARMHQIQKALPRLVTPRDKLKVEKQLAILSAKLDKYAGFRRQLMAKRKEYMEQVNVKATRNLFPNVRLSIADQSERLAEKKGATLAHLQDYELQLNPLK